MSKKQFIEFGKKNRGSILAYSLIILSMMIAIATAISVSTIIGKKGASGTEFSVQSLQTADSGVQAALKKINGNGGANLQTAINGGGNYGGSCNNVGGVATVAGQAIAGGGTYDLTFYEENGTTPVLCTDIASKIGMIKSVGKYKDTVRAVSVAVAAGGITITGLSDTNTGSTYSYTYPGAGTPLTLTAALQGYGGGNSGGNFEVRWLSATGTVIKDWTMISGTNVNGNNDGGSGMVDRELATIPFIKGSIEIEFRGTGGNAGANFIQLISIMAQ